MEHEHISYSRYCQPSISEINQVENDIISEINQVKNDLRSEIIKIDNKLKLSNKLARRKNWTNPRKYKRSGNCKGNM